MVLCFDQFSINTETYQLQFNGEVRPVEPLVFDLITLFATHPNQVFSRDELIETVWKGRIVSDTTIAACVKNARKALDDSGDTQIYIQTVRGRGYRFSATITQTDSEHTNTPEAIGSSTPPLPVGSVSDPSLLILPFRCLSDDLELHRLAASLAIELGTILTRIPLLQLSTQADRYLGQGQPTARQIHEDLGVDLVLDGYLQNPGDKIRLTVQLSNARTGFRLWAESFQLTEPLADISDRCITAVVGKLEPQLHKAMYELVHSASDEPTARQLFLEASGLLVMQGWHHESFDQAAILLRQSTQLDPSFALAPSLLSLLMGFGSRIGLPTDPDNAKAEALQAAEQALKLDSMNSTVLGLSGCGLADIGYLDRGESLLQNAIDLNPANAQAWVALGAVRIVQNNLPEAVAKLSHGIEISPLDSRLSVWGALLAIALLMSGNKEGACEAAETACRRNDRTYLPRLALAGARLAQNNSKLAFNALADARRIKPDLSPRQIGAFVGPDLRNGLLALEKVTTNK